MNYTIIFLLLVVFVLSILVCVEVELECNVLDMSIVAYIKIFHISILKIEINAMGLTYKLNGSKKLKSMNIFKLKKEAEIIAQIRSSVISKIFIDEMNVEIVAGLLNSKSTFEICEVMGMISAIISNKLSNNRDLDYSINIVPNYINNKINIRGYIKIYFTVFDMIFAIVISLFRGKKYA